MAQELLSSGKRTKRRSLADLPLLIKIGFAPALALFMLALVAVGTIWLQKRQSAELQQVVQVDMRHSMKVQTISERITAAHGQLYLLLTHQAGSMEKAKISGQMDALAKDFGGIQADIESLRATSPADEQASLDDLIKGLKSVSSALDVVSAMMGVDFNTAVGFVTPLETQYTKMIATLQKVIKAAQEQTDNRANESSATADKTSIILICAAILTLLLVGGIAVATVLTTRRAVKRIADATETLAGGDNTIDLEALERGDELGSIVRSLTIFRNNQLHLIDLRREQEAANTAAEAERARNEAAATAASHEQSLVVTSLAEGLDRLASGDLTFRLDKEFPGQYRKLGDDFDAAMGQLENALTEISTATSGIRGDSNEISKAADELSRRTEQQAATLEETAAALDEITATVSKTAEGASHARDVVSIAKTDAEHSGEIVRDAVTAMNQIEKSAHEIAQIIGVIDEIAFQTNLLALNAGVEAARAGDAGRGFAVVASEVRALAQRSAEAAKEIKALISASTQQVDSGVGLVGETGKALGRIVGRVNEINAIVVEIAASAKEQATGLGQVNSAVNQMDQVTQQNAAMVEQSTAASHALVHGAEELSNLISRFQVSDQPVVEIKPARKAAAAVAKPKRAPVQMLKTTGGRGGAAKIKPVADEQGWEEF